MVALFTSQVCGQECDQRGNMWAVEQLNAGRTMKIDTCGCGGSNRCVGRLVRIRNGWLEHKMGAKWCANLTITQAKFAKFLSKSTPHTWSIARGG